MKKSSHISCQYVVTTRCNSKCLFCNFWSQDAQKDRELTLEEHKKVIDQLSLTNINYLDFTGGEPLLQKWLPDLARYAKEKGFYTTTTTNCILFPERAHELVGLFDEINFSMDSPDSDVHNKIRGVKCFDNVIKSIELAKELGFKYKICCSTNNNIENILSMVEFAAKYETRVYLAPVFSYFGNDSEGSNSARRVMWLLFEPYIYMCLPLYQMVISKENNEKNLPKCSALKKTLVFSPYGTIYLPCHQNFKDELPLEGDLNNLIDTKQFDKYVGEAGSYDSCNECLVNFHFSFSFSNRFDKMFFLEAISTVRTNFEEIVSINGLIKYKEEINECYSLLLNLIDGTATQDNIKSTIHLKLNSEEESYYQEYIEKNDEFWFFELIPNHFLWNNFRSVLLKTDPDLTKEMREKSYLFVIHLWIFFINKYVKTSYSIGEDNYLKSKNFIDKFLDSMIDCDQNNYNVETFKKYYDSLTDDVLI